MADKSGIEWTDATWNPVTGCSKVSPGCAHCYAEKLACGKLAGMDGYPGLPWTPTNAMENVVLRPERLAQPLHWKRPRSIFVNSMSDLFHEQIPDEFIAKVFAVMAAAHWHVFQVLTKRPERMRDLLSESLWPVLVDNVAREAGREPVLVHRDVRSLVLPNVWLGVSIENRRYVGRADLLRETPAAVRFISAEPLLGPLLYDDATPDWGKNDLSPVVRTRHWSDAPTYVGPELDLTRIDWLVVGGESGPNHRRIDQQWVRDLRDACYASQHSYSPLGDSNAGLGNWTGTRFFFKQWGGQRPKSNGRLLDGRTHDGYPTMARRDTEVTAA